MQGATQLSCGCGLRHRDVSRLVKLGWRNMGGGCYAMLAKCPCGAKLTAARISDASQCDACKRIVTGTDGDVKTCVVERHQALVICGACYRRRARRAPRSVPRWV